MYILKANGTSEKFQSDKVHKAIIKAGGSKSLANETIRKLKKQIHNNITSEKVLSIILSNLRTHPEVAAKYDLKRAIMSMGPSGFPFEKYVAKILAEYGYITKINQNLQGKKVNQEIDVIAKNKYKYMIECKYHNHVGNYAGLKEAMYTYARFLDVKKHGFTCPWLITNTHISNDGIAYANGVKLKITSWKYPVRESLKELIEKKKLYPITIIRSINKETKEKLYAARLMLAKDLLKFSIKKLKEKTNISEATLKKIIEEAKLICGEKYD